ncbi:MAG: type II toxin-antitoxin system VapC family toxin [Candidatus Binatia bacterium]
MIVVDASSVVDVLLGTRAATAIEARWRRDGGPLHAPHLLDIEVLSALRHLVLEGDVTEGRTAAALSIFARFRVRRWPHRGLRARIWELRHNLTAYDAAYVALAERLECPLTTSDAPLARSSGHRARVELF